MDTKDLIEKAKTGFETLKLDHKFKDSALIHLQEWLSQNLYKDYMPQIEHIINSGYWDYLLDCFYQIIPFGTGGRRGEVGIGPNRINEITIQLSAQGHSQYLVKILGEKAKKMGVVLTYDVRKFFTNDYFNEDLPNPVKNLSCEILCKSATNVYIANGFKVYIFDDVRTTPELSFAIRELKASAGTMFSASHNPPEHNGKKVFDQFGGQLVPPFDEALVIEVTQNVLEIKSVTTEEAMASGRLIRVGNELDEKYINTILEQSKSENRSIKILYSPLHGCGDTSVKKVLEKGGFEFDLDESTSFHSGKFEGITFNIPNPEVKESFNSLINFAIKNGKQYDLLINSDPDADRLGVMVRHNSSWQFINGNEIGVLATEYLISKRLETKNQKTGVVIKTQVTSGLIATIAKQNGMNVIGDLLVGFKYIGEKLNELETQGKIDTFIFGAEESHGYLIGSYIREKDAAVVTMILLEYAGELKDKGKTLVDELNRIYAKYGYYRNYLTEIRLPGAQGMSDIAKIQSSLKEMRSSQFGEFKVEKFEDWIDRTPIVSETDRISKQGIVFYLSNGDHAISSIKLTIRPSGTEPKSKFYFEIGSKPCNINELEKIMEHIENTVKLAEKEVLNVAYKSIGVDFPDRGYLLFWQLPLKDKLKYFEIENELAELKNKYSDVVERKIKLDELLKFLGADPIQKIDNAFKAKYQQGVEKYLGL